MHRGGATHRLAKACQLQQAGLTQFRSAGAKTVARAQDGAECGTAREARLLDAAASRSVCVQPCREAGEGLGRLHAGCREGQRWRRPSYQSISEGCARHRDRQANVFRSSPMDGFVRAMIPPVVFRNSARAVFLPTNGRSGSESGRVCRSLTKTNMPSITSCDHRPSEATLPILSRCNTAQAHASLIPRSFSRMLPLPRAAGKKRPRR